MYDVVIVGGGIVGLATAHAWIQREPRQRVAVVEKEPRVGEHQTGHNSGVIHSGIYYKPGSLKARLAREGNRRMVAFCRKHGIAHEVCGKVIVAADESERAGLLRLYQRGLDNGLQIRLIGQDELRELEPHVRGVAAIHVPMTGIVNYRQVCEALADDIRQAGGEIWLGQEVVGLVERGDGVVVQTRGDRGQTAEYHARLVVNCGGLFSDRIARLGGVDTGVRIVPFRGEYYELSEERRHLVRNLIYPVPDPNFPFLGVHFTRMIDGRVDVGPNAVLAFRREGYTKWDVNVRDLGESLTFPGFRRLARKYWRQGVAEMIRSYSKRAFVRNVQRLMPEITEDDLRPAPAGVRAQALTRDGQLVDDFAVIRQGRVVHVCNAPSPAATASLCIGEYIASEYVAPAVSHAI
ncbi:L-2-hydroxyglutarate oxidase [Alicyclobacillus macrosporangiidus]|uniref:L-2-hydroxyglutarate oxidase n=1 Tax=Alicyclobacillus macrosporangiidus TaxID=392015 RepID=A0A1I7GIK3_9BACL|nr:L-2-hydroxyglutarate oxidase [Alicyclobacillus macrosporangiidus]SFU48273.1 L-2-hydroxyglutarate oxidase [Alicyclobacillus macrosporangiidus]